MRTALTESFCIQHPIVQAPMAGVAGGALARAVSAEGALGMIGVGSTTPVEWIGEQARVASENPPFGIGLMAWAIDRRPELLEAALAGSPQVVAISFGDVSRYAEMVHVAGAKLVCQVSDAVSAARVLDAGADAVVAQGAEAGGHTGTVGTLPLLDAVLEVAHPSGRPVLAAGGIGSGRAMAGVLAMGAAGAWVGTRFAASAEALGRPEAKARIVAATEADTVRTSVFDLAQGIPWPEGWAGRALANSFTRRWHGSEESLVSERQAAAVELTRARRAEDYETMYVYAGQAAGVIHDVAPAGEIVRRLVAEADRALAVFSSSQHG